MWISEAIWRLIDERFSEYQDPAKYQSLIWRLGRAIMASLKGDRRRRAEEEGAKVELLLGSDPPTPPGSLSPDKGVVSGCGLPCSAACLGNT